MTNLKQPPHATSELEPLPPFLHGVQEATDFFHPPADWEFDVRRPTLPLSDKVAQFLAAFPWAEPQTLGVSSTTSTADWTRDLDPEDPVAWVRKWEVTQEKVCGLEAKFNLELYWIDSEQHEGRSKLMNAMSWIFDEPGPFQFLTIGVNLFTDEINIYKRTTEYLFDTHAVNFVPAAARNRAQLMASLRQWEQACGEITSWESDRVDDMGKYGPTATAKPIR